MQYRLKELFEGDRPIQSIKHVIMYVVCDSPTEICYYRDCKNCPGFEEVFEFNCIESITYRKWVQVENKATLEMLVTEEVINIFFVKLLKRLHHSFILLTNSPVISHI